MKVLIDACSATILINHKNLQFTGSTLRIDLKEGHVHLKIEDIDAIFEVKMIRKKIIPIWRSENYEDYWSNEFDYVILGKEYELKEKVKIK